MAPRILVVPDKFKGTLTAAQAARAIACGWRMARPQDDLELLPMSDGGDGFGEILSGLLRAGARRVATLDAAHRKRIGRWWWQPRTRTAVVESAQIIGLALLPPGRYHPFELDTFGLGAVLAAAARSGCRRFLIGLGGSATNDGGFGVARALGWQFLDRRGRAIERWTDLPMLTSVQRPRIEALPGTEVIVAVDVQNRLLGRHGCSRVYGPQKGLRPIDMRIAEACLRRLSDVVREQSGIDDASRPGSGAAGGLGFGLMAFAHARVESGTDLFARQARLSDRLRRVDLVLTGEGALDRSTLMGKGVGEIARWCHVRGLPCFGLAGLVRDRVELRKQFGQVRALSEFGTPDEARRRAGPWLTRLARQVASEWSPGA